MIWIWINISVHRWVHPSVCTLIHCVFESDWSAALFVFKCSTRVSFAGFCRGQPMTGDQCMADRGQIDLTSVFLPLSAARCLSHLAWRTQGCEPLCARSVHTWLQKSNGPDWGRLRLIDCTELSVTGQRRGEKDRSGGDGGMHFDGVPVKQTTRRGMSGIGCHWELT